MNQPVSVRFKEYLSIRADLRESSIEILSRAVRWFRELFGDLDVREITFGHIEDYKRWLLNGRSASGANTYLRIMKSFFSWLARRRYITASPFDGLQLYKQSQKRYEIYSVDEIERMLALASDLWKVIICLGLCGMRESEILNLVVSDIDFDKNRIKVTPKTESQTTWLWQIKDSQERFIGLEESIIKLLIARIEILEDCPYVCITRKRWLNNLRLRQEKRLNHQMRLRPWGNFTRDYLKLLDRALVPRKRFHDLRRTFAVNLMQGAFNIKEIQTLMGHSSIQTTQIYLDNINEEHLAVRSTEVFKKYYVSNNTF